MRCVGKVPYPGGDSISKCRRHCEETPWHPRKFVPELDEELVEIIADMMEKDPARRIATAAEVAERLEPWAGGVADVVERPFDSSHWATPPPPAEPSSSENDEPSSRLVISPEDTSISGPIVIPPPPLPSELPITGGSGSGGSLGTAVAITLAIAVPLCLLVGAILGFIIRASLVGG